MPTQCLRSLVRVGRSCFAIRSIAKITAFANAPGRLGDIQTTFRLFTRAQSECRSYALSGVGNDKKFRSSLFKGLQVQDSVLVAPSQWSEISFPKN